MPPTFTDDGLRAAQEIRAELPVVAVLLLSQYVDVVYALKLVREGKRGIGYLLKDRIVDPPALIDAMQRVAGRRARRRAGAGRGARRRAALDDPLAELTAREREILALMAEGRTDRGIRATLWLRQKTVESHIAQHLPQARPPGHAERQPPRPCGPDLPPSGLLSLSP